MERRVSIAPKAERSVLEKSAATNYTIRRKIIDLVLRLDVSTVRTKQEVGTNEAQNI